MHDAAKQAAEEIPGASFVSLAGHSHISAFYEADELLLPHILELLRSATRTPWKSLGALYDHTRLAPE
jgi:hypothetical protein